MARRYSVRSKEYPVTSRSSIRESDTGETDMEPNHPETPMVPAAPVEEEAAVKTPTNLITSEPVLFQAVIQAALGVAMGFGMGVSPEQMGLILVFTAAVLAWITRSQVSPFVPEGKVVNTKVSKN